MFETNMYLAASNAAQSGQQASSTPMLITFALLFLVMYIFLIRPQSKKQKAVKNMLANIKNGDKIVTIGGIYGTIVTIKDTSVVLKVDSNTELEVVRESISNVIPPADEVTKDKEKSTQTTEQKEQKSKSTKNN